MYKPCTPKQRTEDNKDTEKCLVDDINDKEELKRMLKRSEDYMG